MRSKKLKANQPGLSIIIPAYNEEQSLGYVLKDTIRDLPKIVRNYEIIVVDDGSTDNTNKVAFSFAKKNKRIRVIHQKNSGFNKAMITGLRSVKRSYVAYMQAGGQDLIRDMVNCIEIMKSYDLVLGKRGKRIDYNLYRFILAYAANIIYRILFGIKYEDVHWVYIWKTKEVQKLKLDPRGGIFLLVESLVKFQRKGLKVGEASAPYRPRYAGDNKNTSIKVVWLTFVSCFRLWFRLRFTSR